MNDLTYSKPTRRKKKRERELIADLLAALNALTVTTANGQLCFRTGNGIPMGMSKRQERLAKAAILSATGAK